LVGHLPAISDDFPLRLGHVLLVPIRHIEYLTDLSREEFDDLYVVIQEMVKHIEEKFGANGYNIGVNGGEVAGQTLPHLHMKEYPPSS
jgi:diadenosine tetraphosphate (Ap4A) HIT family hydrolase